jgi:hypothetical protein
VRPHRRALLPWRDLELDRQFAGSGMMAETMRYADNLAVGAWRNLRGNKFVSSLARDFTGLQRAILDHPAHKFWSSCAVGRFRGPLECIGELARVLFGPGAAKDPEPLSAVRQNVEHPDLLDEFMLKYGHMSLWYDGWYNRRGKAILEAREKARAEWDAQIAVTRYPSQQIAEAVSLDLEANVASRDKPVHPRGLQAIGVVGFAAMRKRLGKKLAKTRAIWAKAKAKAGNLSRMSV